MWIKKEWPEGLYRVMVDLLKNNPHSFTEEEGRDRCGAYYKDAVKALMELRMLCTKDKDVYYLDRDEDELARVIQHLQDDLEELELARKVNMAQVSAAESADRSAKAAERSARAAEKSIRLSVISIVVSMLSLVAALAAILFS